MKKPHSLKAGLNAMLILLIRLIKNEYALSIMMPASKVENARKKQRYQPTNKDNASFYRLLAVASIMK